MNHPFASFLIAGFLGIVATHPAEAQLRFHLNLGGSDDWCGPHRHHFDYHSPAPIFSPWSPAGYLPYHNQYHSPVSRVIVPSIRYSVAPSTQYVVPSTPEISPTARVASSRPIFSSRRPANTGELVSAFRTKAQEEFYNGHYEAALSDVNEALGVTPNDTELHQLRALALFAQGRYGNASGTIRPLNEAGTTWNWDAMIGHYPSENVYERQFRRLENHVNNNPNESSARYLLGYHYQVGGHLSAAEMMYEQAAAPPIMVAKANPTPVPKPKVLVKAETKPAPKPTKEKLEETVMAAAVSPPPIEPEPGPAIAGNWRSVTDDGKTITLMIGDDGKFTWEYEGAPAESVLSGDWSLEDDGELNLADKDVPLSGTVEMEGDNTMRFVLDGTPEADPGLVFERM